MSDSTVKQAADGEEKMILSCPRGQTSTRRTVRYVVDFGPGADALNDLLNAVAKGEARIEKSVIGFGSTSAKSYVNHRYYDITYSACRRPV